MEIVCEKTVHEEPQLDVNILTPRAESTNAWIVPKHYNLQEDSSEEEDLLSGRKLKGDIGDCMCCVCGETFTFLNNLIEHFNVHKEEVRCHLCQVTFTRAISLALHLENAHPNCHLYCASCKVMFWNVWHMNQHMGQHFKNEKFEPPDEAFMQLQSETQKPQWMDVEEIIIKTEEVEVKCMKEEEEEIPLGKTQEAKESNVTVSTEEDHLNDHTYYNVKRRREPRVLNQAPAHNTHSATRVHKKNGKHINGQPAHVISNKLSQVVVFGALPQRGVTDACMVGLQAGCDTVKRQITEENPHEEQETTCRSEPSASLKLEPVHLELGIKMEDAVEDSLWECAPIEEDIEEVKEEKVEIKEENGDCMPDNSLLPPLEDPGSEMDTASDYSTDCESYTQDEDSIRSYRPRTVQKRQIFTGVNAESVTSSEKPLNSVTPISTLAMTTNTEGCITRYPTKDRCTDHNYCNIKSLSEASVSNRARTYNTRSSTREQSENVKGISSEPVHACSNKDSESEGGPEEKVEIVVLRALPRREGEGESGRVVLQAAYEKVIKTQVPGERPHEAEDQETVYRSSVSDSVSAKLEPVQVEISVKEEDHGEDNLWECAPIEEDLEVKDEESTEIKEESDSIPDLLETETDMVSGAFIDYNSVTSGENSVRLFRPMSVGKKQICTNTNENSVNSVKACAGESSSSNEKLPSPVEVAVYLKPKSSNETLPNSGKAPESKDLQTCASCGLSKVPSREKPTELCKCMSKSTCYMCGVVLGSEQLLLKHQAEDHPLTKYICSSCLQVFPNQGTFVAHLCCKPKVPDPLKAAKNVKNPTTMIVNFVPSRTTGESSKQPNNNGSTPTAPPSLNIFFTNNVINIVGTSQKPGSMSSSTLPVLPNKLGSNQTAPVQVSSPVTLNGDQKMASITLNGWQDQMTPMSMATLTNTAPMQESIPSSTPTNSKPTDLVFQAGVLHQPLKVPSSDPCVPVSTSLPISLTSPSTPVSKQSKVTLRIPSYPKTSNKVSVSFSPTPVKFAKPTFVSSGTTKTLSSTGQRLPENVRPVTVPLPKHPSVPISNVASNLTHKAAQVQSNFNHLDSSPTAVPPPSHCPLSIVTMFVNQSQELSLQKRLRQSWRSKTTFPCRLCGIIARQPALVVRHRYRHRGPRLHRCQCGKTFQQRLHLLRHQVQHAEAMRYVCAACGQTFQGTHQLACHKQRVIFRVKSSNTKKVVRRDCKNMFHCDCGQGFVRSSALLWHMLTNSKSYKRFKKGSFLPSGSAT